MVHAFSHVYASVALCSSRVKNHGTAKDTENISRYLHFRLGPATKEMYDNEILYDHFIINCDINQL